MPVVIGEKALTNTQLRASDVPVLGPLTDAQLRATPVPISGAVSLANVADKSIAVAVSESVAAPTAATWYLKRQWPIPAGGKFRPARTFSVVTTAGSRTFIGVGKRLGSFNLSTNVFTDDGAFVGVCHYARLFAVITTVMSATPTNVTVTYINEAGVAGRTTAALTLAASSPVGNAFEFFLQATTGQMRDNGVRDVTAVSDTAAPTGVIEIWGLNALHDALGVANAYEVGPYTNFVVEDDESIMIMFMQAAVTAQQRGAGIIGSIA